MLKRLALALSLIAAITVGGSALTTSTASAATCDYYTVGSPYWTGTYIEFQAWAVGCIGYDKIEFGMNVYDAGMWDYTYGANEKMNYGTGLQQGLNPSVRSSKLAYYGILPWCVHQTHQVYQYFFYRMHNATWPGTWGPWHQYSGPTIGIVC